MLPIELLATSLLALVIHADAHPTAAHVERALITPAPAIQQPEHAYHRRRDIIDSLTSQVGSYANSLLSDLGSAIPSYVTDGILPNQVDLPTGTQVLSSAGVSSTDLDAKPTQVLNIPGYGNWTGSNWNLRVHGNVYKLPDISNNTIDDLANVFLIDTSVAQLQPSEQDMARNLTRSIYVVQQDDVNVTVNILPGPMFGGDGEPQGGGGQTAGGINQTTQLPYPTTELGDFDVFIPVDSNSNLTPGTGEIPAQRLNVYAQGTDTGNATSYLVSNNGLTVISDIDDILRVTKIYQPKEGLLNSFARPFTQFMNMPDIYRNWSQSLPNMHFHYLTTTPEQVTRNYMDFIYKTYPGGSFDTRPLNFSDVSATLSIRKYLLDRIFQTFPTRKFILVADTSNPDVMRDYPEMAKQYPGQVQCIFLRNTSATDPSNHFPYNTEGFQDLNQQMYMFFKVPDDLKGLDIVNGQCYNSSIPQNVTFSYQGLPFGLSTSNSNTTTSGASSSIDTPYLFSAKHKSGWKIFEILLAVLAGVVVVAAL
ncbi:hypothetical protein LTR05_007218 [Lithohypha guttulata]|uniref:Phosphatidate phosphatase APP1 catalytic domain-containing protein n=1 Tax=Lithohypha guttulata TaxID=1690604 RepID=A0AAN7YDJ1_9EURO|nr:hypothetical protein LTR05_007218 [Lithohypha guttulata]